MNRLLEDCPVIVELSVAWGWGKMDAMIHVNNGGREDHPQ